MGASLWQCSASARQLLEEADRITGLPLSRVCFEGPTETLTNTAYAQPSVVAVSLAAASALSERLAEMGIVLEAAACAGHSVGEYSALAHAGALSIADSLRLVAARGKAMAEASALADGSMVAVLGLDEDSLAEVCARASHETGAAVQIANLNAPGQIVISGNRVALDRASELARSAGAKRALPLDVSGPFHSVYMQPAADQFRASVAATAVSRPSSPVLLNVSAQPCTDPGEIASEMVVQVTSPVRWAESVEVMSKMGCTVFVELGPGQVLSGLTKRIVRDATVLNVEDEASLAKTDRNTR